jgi:hypothetical protein
MALPKIEQPLFELELPSTRKKIKFRPFTVKEEKILLIARESNDIEQALLSVRQVINNCLVDYDIDKLAMFDLEYLLIKIRSKSIDNSVNFSIKDPDTKEKVDLKLDLEDVKVVRQDTHSNMIKIDDEYSLVMSYPTIREFTNMVSGKDPTAAEKNYEIMISCMDKLVSKQEVYKFADFTTEEIEQFVEQLDGSIVKKLQEFFETMPKLRHEIKYKNSQGKENTFVIEGLETFFI